MALVHDHPDGTMTGRIVETEAYPVGDSSGHAFRGLTPRNQSLFLERGHAYVYFIYGCHFCFNVASETEGAGAGVLLRALEPRDGVELMRQRRGTARILDLARGPGRLATAMDIDRRFDGVDLCGDGPLWLGALDQRPTSIGTSVRIGLSRERERVRRFYEPGNPFVSGPKRLST